MKIVVISLYQALQRFFSCSKNKLPKMWILRRILMPMGVTDSMEFLMEKIRQTKNNAEFFESMNQ